MKGIIGYIRTYISGTDRQVWLACTGFVALLVCLNYGLGLNAFLNRQQPPVQQAGWFMLFVLALGIPYGLQWWRHRKPGLQQPAFLFLCLAACLVFSWKMTAALPFSFGTNEMDLYWNHVAYWPFKLAVVTLSLFLLSRLFLGKTLFGLQWYGISTKPYWLMLLLMVPLVAAAATQPDFLHTYPKLQNIGYMQDAPQAVWYNLLFELSYGSDFFTIELFFRGFLVLGLLQWAGRDAILPMACFYCTIHFGKPMGECISSFFGGLLLGTITYHTRSILGGLMVHVGIAWLMEVGGYLGHLWK